ncbi:MAG: NAD+ synthase [Vicingaceae bacterium]
MKIALSQLNYHIGNFEANEAKIIQSIEKAKSAQADLVVFAELSVCGYPPRDFLNFEDFVALCASSIDRIAKHCTGIAAIVGSPSKNHNPKGKPLYNSAYFLADGKVKSVHHKQLLPTYDVFDEYRYFEPAHKVECIRYKGECIALNICEDLWNVEGEFLYRGSPMDSLAKESPDFIVNIAASPFHHHQAEKRANIFKWNSERYKLPIYYVNHIGAQTELVFDGGSCHFNAAGEKTHQMAFFEEDFQLFDTQKEIRAEKLELKPPKWALIEQALESGIRDYFRKLGFKKATLGLSGGIDSALTLVLAVRALGKENVIPILMPSQFSSDHSIDDSLALCKNLGCDYHQIPIKEIYQEFEEKLDPLFKGTQFGVAEENIQSRIRGTLLMAHTNKFGTILLNTSNKSELAVGYGTLYGDMAGGLSVIGDLYKIEVYELSKFINRDKAILPTNIITKEPSAELRPDQKDSDSLPDYDVLDSILFEYIENEISPKKIIELGYEESLVKRILRMVNINEYKRHQAPPILRVSAKAFGMGRRMPIVGKYLA